MTAEDLHRLLVRVDRNKSTSLHYTVGNKAKTRERSHWLSLSLAVPDPSKLGSPPEMEIQIDGIALDIFFFSIYYIYIDKDVYIIYGESMICFYVFFFKRCFCC